MIAYTTQIYLSGAQWPVSVRQTGTHKWEARGKFRDYAIVAKSNGNAGVVKKWEQKARAVALYVYDC